MTATVTRPGKPTRKVQNLGWLLRNWKEVERFEVNEPFKKSDGEALLRAHLKDGGEYTTVFASASVLWDFLHRPVFFGLSLQWMKGKYREIVKGESLEVGTMPDAGSADKPLREGGDMLVYRDGSTWYQKNPASGWAAAREWMRVTDPSRAASLNAALTAGTLESDHAA